MNPAALLDAMAELDDITRRLAVIRSTLADAVVAMGDRRQIDSQFGDDGDTSHADTGRTSAPNDGPVALPSLCHDYCPAEHIAPFCTDMDDPPSRPA